MRNFPKSTPLPSAQRTQSPKYAAPLSLGAPASHAFVAARAFAAAHRFFPRASPTAPYFCTRDSDPACCAGVRELFCSSIKKKAMAGPLAEKVSVLQRQLNLPEGANLVDKVEKALEKFGLADELRGQPLTRKGRRRPFRPSA